MRAFSTSERPKVVRTPQFFTLLTWQCVSCQTARTFFDIWTFKSGPNPSFFFTLWRGNVLRATTACTFSTAQLPKVVGTLVCCVHFDFEMCFAPQRRAILHLSSGQLAPHPAALARLPFDPPEPQIIGKTQWIATFLPFRAPASSCFPLFLFSDFLYLWSSPPWLLPPLLFHPCILSEVWLLNFLRSSLLSHIVSKIEVYHEFHNVSLSHLPRHFGSSMGARQALGTGGSSKRHQLGQPGDAGGGLGFPRHQQTAETKAETPGVLWKLWILNEVGREKVMTGYDRFTFDGFLVEYNWKPSSDSFLAAKFWHGPSFGQPMDSCWNNPLVQTPLESLCSHKRRGPRLRIRFWWSHGFQLLLQDASVHQSYRVGSTWKQSGAFFSQNIQTMSAFKH